MSAFGEMFFNYKTGNYEPLDEEAIRIELERARRLINQSNVEKIIDDLHLNAKTFE